MISSIIELPQLSLLSSALKEPHLHPLDYPNDEQPAVIQLSINLRNYIGLAESFEYALDLAIRSLTWRRQATAFDREAAAQGDYSKTAYIFAMRDRLQAWVEMAARQGALLVNSCAEIMQSDQKQLLSKCPTLAAKVDRSLIKESVSVIEEAFPSVRMIRLAAAHPLELAATIKGREKHATKGDLWNEFVQTSDSSGIMIDGNITVSGDTITYSATIKGSHVGYTLSQATMEKLIEAVRLYLAAFEPARHVPPVGGHRF